jgi:nuclear pore complex protein Nup155
MISKETTTEAHSWQVLMLFDRSDFYEYSDQDQVIVSVGIAKPKPGVFGDQVKYVLVVSTPLQIILLAVSIDHLRAGSNSLNLYGTNIIVPADDSRMIMTKGTDDGRIFLISLDGHLFELDYTVKCP